MYLQARAHRPNAFDISVDVLHFVELLHNDPGNRSHQNKGDEDYIVHSAVL
jgi:hypothetical protein